MRKKGALAALALSLPAVFAQSGIDTVLNFFGDMFTKLFNPSVEGLGIFLKFILIALVFAITYEKLPGNFRKGPKTIIALAFGLGAGLAIPTQLALTTGAFYGSLVVGLLILGPALLLIYGTFLLISTAKTKWIYPGLILGWGTYVVILVYFLAHVGTLPNTYEWVFVLASFLIVISPIVMIVLLGIYLGTEDPTQFTKQSSTLQNFAKNFTYRQVKSNAKSANTLLLEAKSHFANARHTRLRNVDDKHKHIHLGIQKLRKAKRHTKVLSEQAAKMLAEGPQQPTHPALPNLPAGTNVRDILQLAAGIQTDLDSLLIDLPHLLHETNAGRIQTYVQNRGVVSEIDGFLKQIEAVSYLTKKAEDSTNP